MYPPNSQRPMISEKVRAEMLKRAMDRLMGATQRAQETPQVSQEELDAQQTRDLDRTFAVGMQQAASRIGNVGGETRQSGIAPTFQGMTEIERAGLGARQARATQAQADVTQAEEGYRKASEFDTGAQDRERRIRLEDEDRARRIDWEDKTRPLELRGLKADAEGKEIGTGMSRLNFGQAKALTDPKSMESSAVRIAADTQVGLFAVGIERMGRKAEADAVRKQWAAFTARNPSAMQTSAFLKNWGIDPKEALMMASQRPKSDKDAYDLEQSLRKEYTARPDVRRADEVRAGAATVLSAFKQAQAGNPAADIALIFGYMKVLDPGSTVREGEYTTVRRTGGIPSEVWGLWQQVQGKAPLRPEVRQAILDQTIAKSQGELGQLARVNNEYTSISDHWGISTARIGLIPTTFSEKDGEYVDFSKVRTEGAPGGQSKMGGGGVFLNGMDLPPVLERGR